MRFIHSPWKIHLDIGHHFLRYLQGSPRHITLNMDILVLKHSGALWQVCFLGLFGLKLIQTDFFSTLDCLGKLMWISIESTLRPFTSFSKVTKGVFFFFFQLNINVKSNQTTSFSITSLPILLILYEKFSCITFNIWQVCLYNFYFMTSFVVFFNWIGHTK